MSQGITFAKIVVAAVVVAAVLGATPAMDLMRRHGIWPMAAAHVRLAPSPQPRTVRPLPRAHGIGSGRTASATDATAKRKKKAADAFDRYEIPAGRVLAALLRAPLESATARVNEPVRAILRSSLTYEGLELIAAASLLHGRVLDVIPASRWQPRGRIVVAFHSVEHARTGTRIALAAQPLVFEPADAGAARRSIDVRVKAGELLHVALAKPLVIRLPR